MSISPKSDVVIWDPAVSRPEERVRLDILSRLATPIWVYDFDRKRVIWANRPALALWQADSLEELASRDLSVDMSETVDRRLKQYRDDFIRSDSSFTEFWTLYPKGIPVSLRVLFNGIKLPDGRMAMLVEAGPKIEDSPETVRSTDALVHTSVMVTLTDMDGNPLYRNPAARVSAVEPGQTLDNRMVNRRDLQRVRKTLKRQGEARIVSEAATAGGLRWHEFTLRKCHDAATGAEALLIAEVDVSDLREAERRANYLAFRDPLTRLVNRAFILEEGQRMIADAADRGRGINLLFLDLDRFKGINDSLGHNVGDMLLVEIANRIARIAGGDAVVGRHGGDEFVVLLTRLAQANAAQDLADAIQSEIAKPVHVEGYELRVSCSVGIAAYPDHGTSMDELIKNADIAMYAAKAKGRSAIAWYNPEMAAEAERRLTLELNLRRALDQNLFEVHFQPRFSMESREIIGAEALLRWTDPVMGTVPPSTFIPLAEETGLIRRIGLLALEKAMVQQKLWASAGHRLRIAVNVSSREFETSGYSKDVIELARSCGVDPMDFELEITESLLLSNDEATQRQLAELKSAGFSIAVDDFGTGYSNLAYMQQYPVDCLKIDRSFISRLPGQSAIAEMIIALCLLLNLRIVAEGVETEAQFDWLKAHGAHECQGFLFSPALATDDFERYLEG